MKLLKKIIIIIYICIFLFQTNSFADDYLEDISDNDSLETFTENYDLEPNLNSKYAIAIDRKTHYILYEKNSNERTPMASTTKIMTCILAIENANLSDIVTVSKKAGSISGSTLGINENDKISVKDLLYGLMLRSGNDCAIAIAEHISGSVENFSVLMNKKAKELHLENTNFVTPHGLDNDNHYTTAYELAILTDYALKDETFKQIVSTKKYAITINTYSRVINNTNELLGNCEGVYGVKTGFTFNSGRCLVSACKRNDLDIIVVVLGADTKKFRTTDSKNIINYIFKNFEYVNTKSIIENSFENYKTIFYNNLILEKTTDKPLLKLSVLNNYRFPLKRNDIPYLRTKVYTIQKFSPKNLENAKIGYISLYNNDTILYSLDIIQTNNLSTNTPLFYFKYLLKNMFYIK